MNFYLCVLQTLKFVAIFPSKCNKLIRDLKLTQVFLVHFLSYALQSVPGKSANWEKSIAVRTVTRQKGKTNNNYATGNEYITVI